MNRGHKLFLYLYFLLVVYIFFPALINFYEYHTVNIFKLKNNNYILKIIEKRDFRKNGIEEDMFYYQQKNKKLGCGKLNNMGIDLKKEYLYGNLDYKHIGVYYDGLYSIIGREVFFIDEPYRDKAHKKITEICNGYFILNLKTGEYESNLSKIEFDEKLLKLNIKKEIFSVSEFLKKRGKKVYNHKDIEYWMTTREP